MKILLKFIKIIFVFCVFFFVFYIFVLWLFVQVVGFNWGNVEVVILNGKVVGVVNVGQIFMEEKYFWGCFLCVGDGYDVISLVGSNKGLINFEYLVEVEVCIDIFFIYYLYLVCKDVFVEMVIVSVLGLDLDIILQSVYV